MKYEKSSLVFQAFRKSKAKVSQTELAKVLQCHFVQISQWERGIARVPPRCLYLMKKNYKDFPIEKYHKEYLKEHMKNREYFLKQELK